MHVQEDPCGLEPFTVKPCEPGQPFDLFGWSFDPETGRCSGYAIGDGCYGNANAFATREECVDTCDAGTKSPCEQKPFAVGTCANGEIGGVDGWSLNPATQKCERFQTRSGCPANDNFFTSENECLKKCGDGPRPCVIDDDCEGLTDDPFCGTTCGDGECLICAPLPLHSATAMFCPLKLRNLSAMCLGSFASQLHLAGCTVLRLGPCGRACRIKSTDNFPPPRK